MTIVAARPCLKHGHLLLRLLISISSSGSHTDCLIRNQAAISNPCYSHPSLCTHSLSHSCTPYSTLLNHRPTTIHSLLEWYIPPACLSYLPTVIPSTSISPIPCHSLLPPLLRATHRATTTLLAGELPPHLPAAVVLAVDEQAITLPPRRNLKYPIC